MNEYGIPEVFESEAVGRLKVIYQDIKFVLKIPVVNFIFRTLANYPEFLEIAWNQVRPNMLTVNMEEAAKHLRYPNISAQVPDLNWNNYDDRKIQQQIEAILTVFNYVNPKLLLIASAWEEALSDRPIVPKKKSNGFLAPGIIQGFPSIELVHIPHVDPYMKDLLKDVAQAHHTYDVASDYRTLAKFPHFLGGIWPSLKTYIQGNEYQLLSAQLKSQSVQLIQREAPYPVHISKHQLKQIYEPSQIAGIMGLVAFFQSFLPGLIIEGEYMRRSLIRPH
ncbi:halocarboxylic acid dehydrogenase DehI family protein [Terrihalobacillus insolitus]|uniref:halocarboxylic acid dehydrogenase DehI family protein n=1 Tax=Terrihalobacillus insolitus TaxID=2950438 RepID=UPI00233FA1B1|nr:halocarboxylic acid dehydrogenase DehI family protein [Terrihalobacillus insolitus]MDC3414392.1 halocarboxylic acid dehydrogenase DehI family protein [Terrihalobacillus insolitus]